jgi:hypothetical protein
MIERRYQHHVADPETHPRPQFRDFDFLREPGGVFQTFLLHLAQKFERVLLGSGHG